MSSLKGSFSREGLRKNSFDAKMESDRYRKKLSPPPKQSPDKVVGKLKGLKVKNYANVNQMFSWMKRKTEK